MLELMGSKKVCRRILEVVSGAAAHKFTVFQIQPSGFYRPARVFILSQISTDNQLIIQFYLDPAKWRGCTIV